MLPDNPDDDIFLDDDDEVPPNRLSRTQKQSGRRAQLRVVDNSREAEAQVRKGWTKVNMKQLADRAWDRLFPPKVRLYLYLQNEVHKGNPITLTNAAAAKLGLNRQNKWRELRRLELMGLVTVVVEDGQDTSVVLWHAGPPTPDDPSRCP
jgi:predicted transcriptional regulator